MRIGILDLQGDVSEHVAAIEAAMKAEGFCGQALKVKTPQSVRNVDALIITGGESTTIGKLLKKYGIDSEIKKFAKAGKPIMGTCAGLIIAGKDALNFMDITAERNAFGRQKESFEADLTVPALGKEPYPAVFIRAPYIKKAGKKVEVLAEYDGKIVMAREGNILALAFHPELTTDFRVQRYFLRMLK
jgi:pyridoxal 5'-phosphate synthase pdxT subunit